MLVAGIDVGVKNLGVCIIDSEIWNIFKKTGVGDSGIKLWKNINLITHPKECSGTLKNGLECKKVSKWRINDTYFCGIHKVDDCKPIQKPQIKNISMTILKRLAYIELDKIDLFNFVDTILIETQPSKNQQMKMFASGIESYFVIRQKIDNKRECIIKNSPAKNKLKLYDGDYISTSHIKDPYAQRKFLAQKHTEFFLRNDQQFLHENYFNNKKKDDLADAFLHALYFIENLKN